MTKPHISFLALSVLLLSAASYGDQGRESLSHMPVKEVTVFKDGHSFVLHEGEMPTSASGDVVMDYLPTAVLGIFWPYSADKTAKLTSVVAGRRIVKVSRTAIDLLKAHAATPAAKAVPLEVSRQRRNVDNKKFRAHRRHYNTNAPPARQCLQARLMT